MSEINSNNSENTQYKDQQFISVAYNGNTNGLDGGGSPGPVDLPIASSTTLGGIKVGDSFNISSDGKLTAKIDDELNDYSKNPVENATLYTVLQGKANESDLEELAADAILQSNVNENGLSAKKVIISGKDIFKSADNEMTIDVATLKNGSGAKYATEQDVHSAIDELIDGAPEAYATLRKISEELKDSESATAAILTAVSSKAGRDELEDIAYTANYNDLINRPTIPSSNTAVSYFKDDGTYLKKTSPELQQLASKDYVNQRVSSTFKYMGVVETYEALLNIAAENGWFYKVNQAHEEYPAGSYFIYNGEEWDPFLNGQSGETSIIHVDELPLSDIDYDKLYQMNVEKQISDFYLFMEGILIKNEIRWEGEGSGVFCKLIDVPEDGWDDVERHPFMTYVETERDSSMYIYLYRYQNYLLYFLDAEEGEPILFDETHPVVIGEIASEDSIKETLAHGEYGYFYIINPTQYAGDTILTIDILGNNYTYTVDSEGYVVPSTKDAPVVELEEIFTAGSLSAGVYVIQSDSIFTENDFYITLNSNIVYYEEIEGIVPFGGNIESESEIVAGDPIAAGTTLEKVDEFYINEETVNHTKIMTTEDDKDIYFYQLGDIELEDEETSKSTTYTLTTLGYDYLANGESLPSNLYHLSVDILEPNSEYIINSDGINYSLISEDGYYALVDDDGEECPTLSFEGATDRVALFSIENSYVVNVPKTFVGHKMYTVPWKGQRFYTYTDSTGGTQTLVLDWDVYLGKQTDSEDYYIYIIEPTEIDTDGNIVSYTETWQGFGVQEVTDNFVKFNYCDSFDEAYAEEGIYVGIQTTSLVDNKLLTIYEVNLPDEESYIPIGNGKRAVYVSLYNSLRLEDVDSTILVDNTVFTTVEAKIWISSKIVQDSNMYAFSRGEWQKVLNEDDLRQATSGYLTPDNLSKYLTMNNFVYLDSSSSLPYESEADHNVFYVKDRQYYHWNKYSWGWDTFSEIVKVPDRYGSVQGYALSNEVSTDKIYIYEDKSLDTENILTFSFFGKNYTIEGLCGNNGMYYRGLHLTYAPSVNGFPYYDKPVESKEPGLGDYYFYIVDLNPQLVPYTQDDLNQKYGLYYYQSGNWLKLDRYQQYKNTGPRFGGFISDIYSLDDIPDEYKATGYFYISGLLNYSVIQKNTNVYVYTGNTNYSGIKIFNRLSSNTDESSSIVQTETLPFSNKAKQGTLYLQTRPVVNYYEGQSVPSAILRGGQVNINTFGSETVGGESKETTLASSRTCFTSERAYPSSGYYYEEYTKPSLFYEYNNCTSSSPNGNNRTCQFTYNIPDQKIYYNSLDPLRGYINYGSYTFNVKQDQVHPFVIDGDWILENISKIPEYDPTYETPGYNIAFFTSKSGKFDLNLYKTSNTSTIYIAGSTITYPEIAVVPAEYGTGIVSGATYTLSLYENDYRAFNGYAFNLDSYVDYDDPNIVISIVNPGALKRANFKNWSGYSNVSIPYHYAMEEHEKIIQEQFSFGSLIVDSYVKDGEVLFTTDTKSYYYLICDDPYSRGQESDSKYKIIADTNDKDSLYIGYSFDFSHIVSSISFYGDDYRLAGNNSSFPSSSEDNKEMIPCYFVDSFSLPSYYDTQHCKDFFNQIITIKSQHIVKGFISCGSKIPEESYINKFGSLSTGLPYMYQASYYPVLCDKGVNGIFYIDSTGGWTSISLSDFQPKLTINGVGLQLSNDGKSLSLDTNVVSTRSYVDNKVKTYYKHNLNIHMPDNLSFAVCFIDTNSATYRTSQDLIDNFFDRCYYLNGRVFKSSGETEYYAHIVTTGSTYITIENIETKEQYTLHAEDIPFVWDFVQEI